MRIGVDLMGGDTSPQVLFEGVKQAIELLDASDTLVIFATDDVIHLLNSHQYQKKGQAHLEWKRSKDPILMSDDPIFAIRQKKKSSIVLAMKELKKQALDAFISAGNTGALIASATLYLPKLSGINRPALLALLPTEKGSVAVIDVGGNISCKAHHLVQFAQIGAAYQSCQLNIENPRVGLLNIGTESKKGTLEVRDAYQLLKEQNQDPLSKNYSKMQFIGNIEGSEVFEGKVDVLVTTGVTGNILLKTAEGVANFIFHSMSKDFDILTGDAKKCFEKLQKQFNYAEYPGAIISGIDGIVIKCHGYSSAYAMYNSIKGAIILCRKKFLEKIKAQL